MLKTFPTFMFFDFLSLNCYFRQFVFLNADTSYVIGDFWLYVNVDVWLYVNVDVWQRTD